MKITTPQRLDILKLPLSGERLIEASAGTGKTWTISMLYLRLLLGLGGRHAYCRPLGVTEILVVTFTEIATKELRDRIRHKIHELRIACLRDASDCPVYQGLLSEIVDKRKAAAHLLVAERCMDEAAIYTIHGFCHRVLTDNAFESGNLFKQTLVTDEWPLYHQACADFWRRHCHPLPLSVARAVSNEWSGPEALLQDIFPWLTGDVPVFIPMPGDDETLVSRHSNIVDCIDNLKVQWRDAAGELAVLIAQSGVDKRTYSTRYLPAWLDSITLWASQETHDYQLPQALKRFRQSVLWEKSSQGTAPQHRVFVAIDHLFAQRLTLRDLVMVRAVNEVRISIQQEKRRRAEWGFDDLLSQLDMALQQEDNSLLPAIIRRRYPVLMIDEFQDTDARQYRIFHTIYASQQDCALLLIGDPKQAIYAFRGADIFTYIRARMQISAQAQYTLDTNWRSSPAMVSAVNRLFHQVDNPFLFSQIPFTDIIAAPQNTALQFHIDGRTQPALCFWLQSGESVSLHDYQQAMAHQCACQIRDWLTAGQQGRACLSDSKGTRPVQAADISILVRNRNEAGLIRHALKTLCIPSVYLSNRDSVFATEQAKDLLWLLQAILAPQQEPLLRRTLATPLFGLNASGLDAFNHDESVRDLRVEEFVELRTWWRERGILPMLRKFMARYSLAENLLASSGGERCLTDLMHLGELLQEAAAHLDSEHALIRWLARQIEQPDRQSTGQQLRLESDSHLVQVISIHKSKGMEYPLVWLPFIVSWREFQSKDCLWHCRESFQACLDIYGNDDASLLAQEERLAEDMRLFYVALTRSIYHCSLGIAPLSKRKQSASSDIHRSAAGWLIQRGRSGNADYLTAQLSTLQDEHIAVLPVMQPDAQAFVPQSSPERQLAAREFTRALQDSWRITSYSALSRHKQRRGLQEDELREMTESPLLLSASDDDNEKSYRQTQMPFTAIEYSVHSFPRGAAIGTFLHHLLESPDRHRLMDPYWLSELLVKQGLDQAWLPMMQQWLNCILHTPLNQAGVTLSELSPAHRQAELSFYLPIESQLKAPVLDKLISYYDPLSARCPSLDFHQVQGMLKGAIDLVFRWQDKFYLLDYKSNWLGENGDAYHRTALEEAMMAHRYDLQYQLYTLALHRYLRHRITDYDYQRHFGGVIYLFLRGIDERCPGQGIFFCLPHRQLVEGLDSLFSGKNWPLLVQEYAL